MSESAIFSEDNVKSKFWQFVINLELLAVERNYNPYDCTIIKPILFVNVRHHTSCVKCSLLLMLLQLRCQVVHQSAFAVDKLVEPLRSWQEY